MIINRHFDLVVDQPQTEKVRIDSFMSGKIEDLPRSAFSKPDCVILIDGKEAKRKTTIKMGQHISVSYSDSVFEEVEPQDIPLEILYEDDDIVVINKKRGMVVHPGAGNSQDTLVNALAFRYGKAFLDTMADGEYADRPGIVHRLDKDTSGAIICAKNQAALVKMSEQFQNREIKKYYICFAEGKFIPMEGEINSPISRDPKNRKKYAIAPGNRGKEARTAYKVIQQYSTCAFVKVRIFTGRTHQIRVHMKSINHPLVGDPIYGAQRSRFADQPLMLHCFSMEFKQPRTGEILKIEAPVPPRFKEFEAFLQEMNMK